MPPSTNDLREQTHNHSTARNRRNADSATRSHAQFNGFLRNRSAALLGCNLEGRLEEAQRLIQRCDCPAVRPELEALLKFLTAR